jgi:hypothetical protein
MPAFRSVVSVLSRALGDFLYTLKAGPAAASGRPPARQPHDGHRGTGLTLIPGDPAHRRAPASPATASEPARLTGTGDQARTGRWP